MYLYYTREIHAHHSGGKLGIQAGTSPQEGKRMTEKRHSGSGRQGIERRKYLQAVTAGAVGVSIPAGQATAGSAGVSVSLPDRRTLALDQTTSIGLSLQGATDGIAGSDFTVTVDHPSTLTIEDLEVEAADSALTDVDIGDNGSEATVQFVQTEPLGTDTVATVTVRATAVGSGTLSVSVAAVSGSDGQSYELATATEAMAIEVNQIPGFAGDPPTDLDGDSLYEDVDGDGEGTIFDVLRYFENRNRSVIESNPVRFDFDSDGTSGTLSDVLELFRQIM